MCFGSGAPVTSSTLHPRQKLLMISFVSASSAVHVQTSPQPCAFLSGWTFLSFAPTNDQISSHWTRLVRMPRIVSS